LGHADGDAIEACSLERCSQVLEEMPIGGEGEIERLAHDRAQRLKLGDELEQSTAE
jgi:hypothetical protein